VTEDRLTELFHRAFELDAARRELLLAELRESDADLASALERLLTAAREDPWDLDRSPWRGLSGDGDARHPADTPERIGPYRILREIGRGGMGRVFLAEEETDEFRRTIALKVIDRPGPDEEAIRRFRTEVKILASLDHPGIARFLAGGRSPEGLWFLALEYVEGEDLIRHAARLDLDVRARLELFLQVLDSVQSAHERGVVHRDLKPGHLLVGKDGRTRLLDFGISKLFDVSALDGATGATGTTGSAGSGGSGAIDTRQAYGGSTLTRTEWRAMTPAYASPEQFRGERATPLSDVFSLGVVLYELLAGLRPFDGTGRDPRALERAVLETEPEPPSTAARRASEEGGNPPSRPRLPLSPDLDAICLKALRKEPGDRYVSALALAADLHRFLEGRPVEARRGGLRYRAGRFVRRQRSRLLTAAALLLALAAFAIAFRSAREADRLRPPPPPSPRPYPLANVTTRPVEHWEKEFAAAPESVEAGAALAVALIYKERAEEAGLVLARMRQIPGKEADPLTDYVDGMISARLDQPQRALVLFTRARDGALAGGRGEILGKIRASRGRTLVVLGERETGEQEMELALADFEQAGDALSAAQVLNNLAIEALQRGDYVRGEERLEKSLARFRQAGATGAIVFRNLSEVGIRRGRPDSAEKWAREALEVQKNLTRPTLARFIWVLGEALAEQGRTEEAAPLIEEAIGYLRADGDEPDLVNALHVRGRLEIACARFDHIDETVGEIERLAQKSGARASLMAVKLLRGLEAEAKGDIAVARRELAEGRRLQIEESEPVLAAQTDVDRALLELEAGDREAALRILDDPSTEAGIGSSAGVLAEWVRARIDAESGRLESARRRFEKLGEGDAESPSLRRKLVFLRARAALEIAEGKLAEARNDFRAAIAAARAAQWTVAERRLERQREASGAADLVTDRESAQPKG
jgi:eukaryotic-like serine/threonine-protein kinase